MAMFRAAVLLLAVATSMINTAIPTGSGLFTSEVGGQIAFGLFAGGIIRLLVPSAIAISLTAFTNRLRASGMPWLRPGYMNSSVGTSSFLRAM